MYVACRVAVEQGTASRHCEARIWYVELYGVLYVCTSTVIEDYMNMLCLGSLAESCCRNSPTGPSHSPRRRARVAPCLSHDRSPPACLPEAERRPFAIEQECWTNHAKSEDVVFSV